MEDNNRLLQKETLIIIISLLIVCIFIIGLNFYYPIFGLLKVILFSGIAPFIALLFPIVVAIIPILIVFKFTKNLNDKRKFWINMFSISFFIPFANLILNVISLKFNNLFSMLSAAFIGVAWLLVLLPIGFLIIAILPQNIFPHKKFTLLTILSTFCMGWGMILLFIIGGNAIDAARTGIGFNEYKPTIEYIKLYKKEHGIYPASIERHLKPLKIFPDYEYKTFNNQKDYCLNISNRKDSFTNYSYCSSTKLDGCSEGHFYSSIIRTRIGEWIKEENID